MLWKNVNPPISKSVPEMPSFIQPICHTTDGSNGLKIQRRANEMSVTSTLHNAFNNIRSAWWTHNSTCSIKLTKDCSVFINRSSICNLFAVYNITNMTMESTATETNEGKGDLTVWMARNTSSISLATNSRNFILRPPSPSRNCTRRWNCALHVVQCEKAVPSWGYTSRKQKISATLLTKKWMADNSN